MYYAIINIKLLVLSLVILYSTWAQTDMTILILLCKGKGVCPVPYYLRISSLFSEELPFTTTILRPHKYSKLSLIWLQLICMSDILDKKMEKFCSQVSTYFLTLDSGTRGCVEGSWRYWHVRKYPRWDWAGLKRHCISASDRWRNCCIDISCLFSSRVSILLNFPFIVLLKFLSFKDIVLFIKMNFPQINLD